MKNSKTKKTGCFLKRLLAIWVDVVLIFGLTLCIDRLLLIWVYFPFWGSFSLCFFLYYFLNYYFWKTTIGNYFFGMKWSSTPNDSLSAGKILFRELCKTILLIVIPCTLVLELVRQNISKPVIGIVFLSYVCILLILWIIRRNPLWNWQAEVFMKKAPISKKAIVIQYFVIIFSLICCSLFVLGYNNYKNYSDEKIMGFNFPFKLKEYPANRQIGKYVAFLEQPLPIPQDYILNLFNKYDIVILHEAAHDATPEWDLIYKIVSDRRFIDNVGTVFTEYGGKRFQNEVDTFLRTNYQHDTLVEKAVATLWGYRRHGYNFPNFLKKINLLNQNLPDSLKIRECFTCSDYGKYFTAINYDTDSLYNISKSYDKEMADVVIDWYENTHRKCLVITNYRHAFMLTENGKQKNKTSHFKDNEAQYIRDRFPKNTANVMYYGGGFYKIVHNGKWRTAFKVNRNKPVGFDLKNSPFGKDRFDLINFCKADIAYEDVFTGIVFDTPEESELSIKWGNRFAQYGVEQEYTEAIRNHLVDSTTLLSIQIGPTGFRGRAEYTIQDILKYYQTDDFNLSEKAKLWIFHTGVLFDFIIFLSMVIFTFIMITVRLLCGILIKPKT